MPSFRASSPMPQPTQDNGGAAAIWGYGRGLVLSDSLGSQAFSSVYITRLRFEVTL
jgi:hypothetical protein